MSSIYIFKKNHWIPWGYKQYPQDNFTIFKYLFQMALDNEQIMIYREGSNLYYAYIKKLANGERVGVGLKSDKICNDYNTLLENFRSILKQLSDEELVIVENSKSELVLSKDSFKDIHVNLNIYISTHKLTIKGKSIPVANINIPKDDVVRCKLRNRSSSWIVERINDGYHKVFITIEPSSPKPFNSVKLGEVLISILGIVIAATLSAYVLGFMLPRCNSNTDKDKNAAKDTLSTVKTLPQQIDSVNNKVDSSKIAPVVAERIKEKEVTTVSEPVEKKPMTKEERFNNAIKNNDWNSMKQLADEGYSRAYIPLARHYMNNPRQHGLAKKYAEKAKRAGIAEATDILNKLEDLDY